MIPHDHDPCAVNSLVEVPGADPVNGTVRWDPVKSAWISAMTLGGLAAPVFFPSWGGLAVFVLLTGATLLLGHSVGFHRRLIHRSFETPLWVEHILVYAGVMVGMCGPHGIIRTHDTRDWAQRHPACHPYLSHASPMAKDAFWQLHCTLTLDNPPGFDPGPRISRDRFYRFLEATWMWQQLPLALTLYALGGVGWVLWGVCARVAVSLTGHWFVGWFAHNRGPQTWVVDGAGVQAYDVPWAAIPTFGEAWHNNHHAWPGSARIGLYPAQADWGFRFIQLLERLGLARDVRTPLTMPQREVLVPAAPQARMQGLSGGVSE